MSSDFSQYKLHVDGGFGSAQPDIQATVVQFAERYNAFLDSLNTRRPYENYISETSQLPVEAYFMSNAYRDITNNWRPVDTGKPAWALSFDTSTDKLYFYSCAAGTDPIVWAEKMSIDASSGMLLPGTLEVANATITSFTVAGIVKNTAAGVLSGGNQVLDSDVNWGTGATQVSAVDIPVLDFADYFTGTEIETVLQELGALMHDPVTLDTNADSILSLTVQQIGLDTQTANYGFFGPTTGAAAVPTFRALVAADIPSLSASYVTVDQTTPQTIINGIPLLDSSRVIDEAHELVDKKYVDDAIGSVGARFYALDAADTGGTAYKLTSETASAGATATLSTVGVTDDQYIMGWISPVGATFTKLLAGIYDFNIFAEKTAGTKTLRIYWKLYEYKVDTSEVLIGTSNDGDVITSKERQRIYITLSSDYTPAAGSRIVGKIYSAVSGSGLDPTLALYYEGDEDSHWEIPTNVEILTNTFVPYSGAVSDVDLGSKDLTTTGDITAASITLDAQTANTVFAGPTAAPAAVPTFRALDTADIPDLSGTYSTTSHNHKLDDLNSPDDNTDLNASTTAHGLAPKATAPAAGVINYLGIANGETAYKMVPGQAIDTAASPTFAGLTTQGQINTHNGTPGTQASYSGINIANVLSTATFAFGLSIQGQYTGTDATYAMWMNPTLDPGNNKSATAFYAGAIITATAGQTVSNAYGGYVAALTKTGTGAITNAVSLYLAAQTIGTNNWSLYVNSGNSYFGGEIGVGKVPVSSFDINGSFASVTTATAIDLTLTAAHSAIEATGGAGGITITLPTNAAGAIAGRIYTITKVDAGAGAITLDGNAAELINGAATQSLAAQWDSITIKAMAAADWMII